MIEKLWILLRETGRRFGEQRVSRMAAALAYYTMFSLAPLLVICITIASQILGDTAVRGELVDQITNLVGSDAAEIIQTMIAGTARNPGSGIITTILGVIALWWAASNLLSHVQQALNSIWAVKPRASSGVWGFLRARLLAILMVIGLATLLVFSVVILALSSALNRQLMLIIPNFGRLASLTDLIISSLILVAAFSAIYKLLPNVTIGWRDVSIGAIFTSLLLIASKYLISYYLSNAGFQSVYGAAGSMVILLVWVYYSAQIFLFGAAFTREYAQRYGSRRAKQPIVPAIRRVTSEGDDEPWPALSFAANRQPPAERSNWLVGAVVAFVVGLVVGARKGRY